ncbi:Zinc finger, RING/FYVE/PHD-type [Phytophthora cinnamomi]|uniref:Zinc finger, RING/FYVE/PHD-type n=1 Tax=Phytophthora cinnamomi TaxID=4785 RepID=UPI00355A1E15|nr:Zinc finger, RING/FYVE/PHD-type [Phytophthora cinnamomi]
MRFPLPADTFPTLSLPLDDQDALKNLATAFVDDALVEYRAFRNAPLNGVVDGSRWKLLKKRDGLTSYLDRELGDPAATRNAERESVGTMSFSKKLHGVLTVGTIDGSLHDQMYGMHHCSMELMRIKSAYMEDKIADGKIICEISHATPENPVSGLYIKWSVSDFAPAILRQIVRPRDFVFLDGTGMIEDPVTQEQVGYSVMHSLQIPGIHELKEYQIVRATLSICALFRQKSSGVVEVYMKGFVDSMGDIHTSVAIPATAEALMSYRKGAYCGQMKKLNWLLKTKKTVMLDRLSGVCSVCERTVKKSSAPQHMCQVCMHQVCSACSVMHKLAFLSPSRRIVRRSFPFCIRCIRVAVQADGLDVASEELRRQNPLEYFEISSSDSGTPAEASSTKYQTISALQAWLPAAWQIGKC